MNKIKQTVEVSFTHYDTGWHLQACLTPKSIFHKDGSIDKTEGKQTAALCVTSPYKKLWKLTANTPV